MTIAFMILVNTPGSWSHIYSPLEHAEWNGYTPTDLVFPFFLVAVGLAMSFSFKKYAAQPARSFYGKVIRRTLFIFFLSWLLHLFPFYNKELSHLRYLGVLQRIALSYFFAALLIRNIASQKTLIYISLGMLLFYWLVLFGFGGPDPFSLTGNIVIRFDRWVMGESHMWHGKGIAFDPEGILSTLPAIVSVLSGYFIGHLIQRFKSLDVVAHLLILGNILLLVGYTMSLAMPINKSLWTSSFVMVTSGLAAVVLGLLTYIIDIKGKKGWIAPFLVFGMNPLFIYILSILWVKIYFIIHIGDQNFYAWFYDSVFRPMVTPTFGSLLFALFHVLGCWLIGYILYRKKIFIKV